MNSPFWIGKPPRVFYPARQPYETPDPLTEAFIDAFGWERVTCIVHGVFPNFTDRDFAVFEHIRADHQRGIKCHSQTAYWFMHRVLSCSPLLGHRRVVPVEGL